MTQAIENPVEISVASGTTDVFATVWTFEAASDVVVAVDAGSGYVLQEQGVAYVVAAGDWLNTGANIVFQPGYRPAAGYSVARRRMSPVIQVHPFGDDARFRPTQSEESYDRLTRMAQENREVGARSVTAPLGEPGLTLPKAAQRRGGLAYWLDSVSATLGYLSQSAAQALFKGDPGGNVMAVGVFTALAGLTVPAGTDLIQTSGYATAGFGRAQYAVTENTGETAWRTQTADGRWFELVGEYITPEQLGATGADQSAAVQAAMGASVDLNIPLRCRTGKPYPVANLTPPEGLHWEGMGAVLVLPVAATGAVLDMDGVKNVTITDLKLQGGLTSAVVDVGMTEGTRHGVRLAGLATESVNLTRVTAEGFNGSAFRIENLGHNGTSRGVQLTDCNGFNSWAGLNDDVRGEYVAVNGGHWRGSRYGHLSYAGNLIVTGAHIDFNIDNLYLTVGENDSHGSHTGCTFNHAAQYAIVASNITHGYLITGCGIYDGDIFLNNAAGVRIVNNVCGGVRVYAKGGLYNAFNDNVIDGECFFEHGFDGDRSYLETRDNRPITAPNKSAYNTANYSVIATACTAIATVNATAQTVKFTSPSIYDLGVSHAVAYDATTGLGTVPLPAVYSCGVNVDVTNTTAASAPATVIVFVRINGADITPMLETLDLPGDASRRVTLAGPMLLNAGDTYDVRIQTLSGTVSVGTGSRLQVHSVS